MRVTHVITRLIVGGAQENTIASVLGLRAHAGLQVRLLSGLTSGPEGTLQPQVDAIPGLLTLIPSLVRPVHPAQDIRALVALYRLFRRESPDLVHTHSGKAGILGRLAARAARVPVIVHTIHGPSFGSFQGALPNFAFRTAERVAARCTHHFVAVAQAMAQQYLAAGIGRPEQFTRIVSGFPLEPYLKASNDPGIRQRLGLSPDHLVIGKIARLFALKGHDDLVAAAPELVRDVPRIRFLLVGDGPWQDRLRAEIDRRGLTRHFVFAGLVDPARVPELVGIMDVLVHLSRREGLARALPQALAAGRPVVAYDCDGANEVCLHGRTGFLVAPGHLAALRERLRLLASDPALRTELGSHGRELVRTWFPVERMIEDLLALYRRRLTEIRHQRPNSPFQP